ncbi:hypothetical protein GWK47_025903 [Chionoecetes opilio]|uniref:Uncharacterized protein n=1 Tax=Chionoecetes opilio TaxID=41210 RepID=A0A8J8WAS4_CHIOP|nr:hypothetical protein GWK47_025903 [Chionoecetes opilio]
MLVDTGCSRSIAHVSCCKAWKKGIVSMTTVSGEDWQCEETGIVRLQLSDGAFTTVRVSCDCSEASCFEFIFGMDGIKALRGVTVDARNGVRFGVEKSEFFAAANTVVAVDERDFSATYDPVTNSWTAAWKWSEGKEPDVLKNQVES